MDNTVVVSSLLGNILIVCFCIMMLTWAAVAINTILADRRREKREEKRALRDEEYHKKRMEEFK